VDAARVGEDAAVPRPLRHPALMSTGPTVTADTEDTAVTLVTTADTGVDTAGPPPPRHRLPVMATATTAPREANQDHTDTGVARVESLVDAARVGEDAAVPRPLRHPALMDPFTIQCMDGMVDMATPATVGMDPPMTTTTTPAPTIAREASLDLAEDPRVARPVPQLMMTTMIRHTPCPRPGGEDTMVDGTREDGILQAQTTLGLEDGLGRPCGRMMMTTGVAHPAAARVARVEARVVRVDGRS